MYALRLARINLLKHISSVNFWTPFILAIAAVYEFTHPLANMASHYSIPVNGFAVSFLFSSFNQTFIIFLGVFILFSDLPFKDNQQMFMVSRSGKRAWIFSQVFYVAIVSLMYFAFIVVCFCAFTFPNIGFDVQNWGKIIRTISATNAASMFELTFNVPKNILSDFSPLEAFLCSFGMAYVVAVVLGLLIFLLNLTVKHKVGIAVSGSLIFLYMVVHLSNNWIISYFSPIDWCSILHIDKNGISIYPDLSFAIIVLLVCVVVEMIALYIFGGKRIKFILDTKEEIV